MKNTTKKKLSLFIAISGLSFVWLVVLPACADRPAMRQHLQWLDEKGIDPSAMYYTELEVMEKILKRRRGLSNSRTLLRKP